MWVLAESLQVGAVEEVVWIAWITCINAIVLMWWFIIPYYKKYLPLLITESNAWTRKYWQPPMFTKPKDLPSNQQGIVGLTCYGY